MNLPQFLKKIDTFSSRMSRDQLERLVHEIARTTPEQERERLLFLFTAFAVEDPDSSRGGTGGGEQGFPFDDDKNNESLKKEISPGSFPDPPRASCCLLGSHGPV